MQNSVRLALLSTGFCLCGDFPSFFNSFLPFSFITSAQIENPLAIRSLIKGLHSHDGNKGDGGDHSGLQSLHGTGASPIQNSRQSLTGARGKRVFDKDLTVLYVRGCSRQPIHQEVVKHGRRGKWLSVIPQTH